MGGGCDQRPSGLGDAAQGDPMQVFHHKDERLTLTAMEKHVLQEGHSARLARLRAAPSQARGVCRHAKEREWYSSMATISARRA